MLAKEILNNLFLVCLHFLVIAIIIIVVLLLLIFFYSNQFFFIIDFLLILLRIFTYFSLALLSCIQFLLWFYFYLHNVITLNSLIFFDNLNFFKDFFFETFVYLTVFGFKYKFTVDLFGLVLQSIGIIIGYISYTILDTRFFNKNIKYLSMFVIFIFVILIFTTTTNIIIFFILYELLLLPSFLLVYFLSQARRATQASLYFIILTQIGSFLVLCGISYLVAVTNLFTFSDLRFFKFTGTEAYILYILFFIGFGFKVPI
jgi:NADH:ubiquinone oxidoreductase subunit 4 (subunit M)